MSRHWRERHNPEKHSNFMGALTGHGISSLSADNNLIERWVFFVMVSGFTFQFHSLTQLQECLDFFKIKVHPSTRSSIPPLKHWYHSWHERLPQWLFKEAKGMKVITALEKARSDFLHGRA